MKVTRVFRVVATDHVFPSADIERRELARVGAELAIGRCRSEEEVVALARDADVVLNTHAPLTRRVIGALTRCRAIVRYGLGAGHVDVGAAAERGIPVADVPDHGVSEASDHTLALLLALARQIVPLDRAAREGGWDARPARRVFRLEGRVLGVIGLGRIGRAVVVKARAFGLRPLAHDPLLPPDPGGFGVELVQLDRLLQESDFVSIHCPLAPSTRGMIGRSQIALMKPTACLINTARGGIVDEDALAEALASRAIAGAGIDVLESEPPDPDHPLLRLDNAIVTPHAACYSEEATAELQLKAAQEVVRALTGQPLRYPVRPACCPS